MESQNGLKVFEFEENRVRIVLKDGEPWFVAKDVAEALGYSWNGEARIVHVPREWRGVTSVVTPSGIQKMQALSEQGVYFFLARSDKPAALPFQKKIAGEILPSIRKHGAYLTESKIEEILADPDTLIKVAKNLKAEREKRLFLEDKIYENRPKVLFAESVEASVTTISVGDLSKILYQNGVKFGQNRLFEWMRDNGYLMKTGDSRNLPTQKSMEAGLFKICERVVGSRDGSLFVTRTPRVTGRGQVYFINLLINKINIL